MDKGDEMMQF